jgi:hypothetical protein
VRDRRRERNGTVLSVCLSVEVRCEGWGERERGLIKFSLVVGTARVKGRNTICVCVCVYERKNGDEKSCLSDCLSVCLCVWDVS